jgi:hypothetical protein
MKAFLMHRDRDFDLERPSPGIEADLKKDLALETLVAAMAKGDPIVSDVVQKALLAGVGETLDTITYRQAAVKDAIRNPSTMKQFYGLAQEALQRQKKVWPRYREYPSGTLDTAVEHMAIFVDVLKRLRDLADRNAEAFQSEAFSNLCRMLAVELDDAYFKLVNSHLKRLKFRDGVLVSAGLGKGLKGVNYVLRRSLKPSGSWFARIFARSPVGYSIRLAPRDEAGAKAMSELRDRGLGLAADALAKSAEHILSFFKMLQTELAFNIGCVNLHERVLEIGAPFSFPAATPLQPHRLSCADLYDVCLALNMNRRILGNDIEADDKNLVIVTGANQGGKTTLLRSLGLAQLMMQCGMFAPAARLEASIVDGLFTHFKREEDATMKSGKFDEELSRMNEIANRVTPHASILFNESFAATNEREGSEIARQIVSAVLEGPRRVAFVSHQFAFTDAMYESRGDSTLFLRADRHEDGRRTFRLIVGKPLPTSFGEDVYREVFLRDAAGQDRIARHAPRSVGRFAAEKDAWSDEGTDFARAQK